MAGSHRERDDDYSAQVVRLNEGWRVILCRDGLQWILQQRGEGAHWRAVRFCTTAAGLAAAVGVAGPIGEEARAVIASLPPCARTHARWREAWPRARKAGDAARCSLSASPELTGAPT